MQENSYSEIITEQLQKSIRTSSAISWLLGIVLFTSLAISIYNLVVQGKFGSTTAPILLLVVPLLSTISNVQKIKSELKSRENK